MIFLISETTRVAPKDFMVNGILIPKGVSMWNLTFIVIETKLFNNIVYSRSPLYTLMSTNHSIPLNFGVMMLRNSNQNDGLTLKKYRMVSLTHLVKVSIFQQLIMWTLHLSINFNIFHINTGSTQCIGMKYVNNIIVSHLLMSNTTCANHIQFLYY